jgi:hypothetical protein
MSVHVENLYFYSKNILEEQRKTIDHNIFLTTKQENYLSSVLTEKLSKNFPNNNFATQLTSNILNPKIHGADIVEFAYGHVLTHIECKFLYSTDFKYTNSHENPA